jgi:hypothetical protein
MFIMWFLTGFTQNFTPYLFQVPEMTCQGIKCFETENCKKSDY